MGVLTALLANLDPPHQSDWLGIVGRLVQQGATMLHVLRMDGKRWLRYFCYIACNYSIT